MTVNGSQIGACFSSLIFRRSFHTVQMSSILPREEEYLELQGMIDVLIVYIESMTNIDFSNIGENVYDDLGKTKGQQKKWMFKSIISLFDLIDFRDWWVFQMHEQNMSISIRWSMCEYWTAWESNLFMHGLIRTIVWTLTWHEVVCDIWTLLINEFIEKATAEKSGSSFMFMEPAV